MVGFTENFRRCQNAAAAFWLLVTSSSSFLAPPSYIVGVQSRQSVYSKVIKTRVANYTTEISVHFKDFFPRTNGALRRGTDEWENRALTASSALSIRSPCSDLMNKSSNERYQTVSQQRQLQLPLYERVTKVFSPLQPDTDHEPGIIAFRDFWALSKCSRLKSAT